MGIHNIRLVFQYRIYSIFDLTVKGDGININNLPIFELIHLNLQHLSFYYLRIPSSIPLQYYIRHVRIPKFSREMTQFASHAI